LEPNNPKTFANLAIFYYETGEYAEAAEAFERALASAPGDAELHYNLGMSLRKLGRNQDAQQHFAEARRLNPNLKVGQ